MQNKRFSTPPATSVLLWVVLIAGCAAQAGPDLNATRWSVVELNGHAPVAGSSLTMGFEDGGVGGSSGCNTYGGRYEIEGSSIVISDLVSTLMACTDPLNAQEGEFLGALSQAASFEVSGGRLILKDGSSSTILAFAPA